MKNQKVHLYLFILILLAGIAVPDSYIVFSAAAGILALILFDIKGLKEFGSPKFWIFIVLMLLLMPVILGKKNGTFAGIPYSIFYFQLGVKMCLRAVTIYSAITILTRNVSINELAAFFRKLGFKELSIMLPIALNILPVLRQNCIQIIKVFKMKGGFRRNRIRNSFKLLFNIILNTVRTAEEISQALELKHIGTLKK